MRLTILFLFFCISYTSVKAQDSIKYFFSDLRINYYGMRSTVNVDYLKFKDQSSLSQFLPSASNYLDTMVKKTLKFSGFETSLILPLKKLFPKIVSDKHYLSFGICYRRAENQLFELTPINDQVNSVDYDIKIENFDLTVGYNYVLNPKNKFKFVLSGQYSMGFENTAILIQNPGSKSSDSTDKMINSGRFFMSKGMSHTLLAGLQFRWNLAPYMAVFYEPLYGSQLISIDKIMPNTFCRKSSFGIILNL